MTRGLPYLENLAQDLLAGRDLRHHLWLRFGDCSVRLDSDSPDLVKSLLRYYKDFLAQEGPCEITVQALEGPAPVMGLPLAAKEPDPGKRRIKEEFCDLPGGRLVRKRLTGMVFLFGRHRHLAVGPCLANDNQVVNFINSRHIQWLLDRDHLLCHAAAVSTDAGGLALAGFSGMGKSTLALHLMSLGLNFVSNDRLLIRQRTWGLSMQGVAKLPRINPGTALNNPDLTCVIPEDEREMYLDLPTESLWNLERKYDAYLDRCFGAGRFQITSPMRALFILNWRGRQEPCRVHSVDLPSRHDLLQAFIKSPGLFHLSPQGEPAKFTPQAYLQALAGCPVFELTGSPDFAAAAQACREILDQVAVSAQVEPNRS